MDIIAILLGALAAFGAGTLAASIGAVNAFILTGIMAIVGGVAQCLGLADGLTGIVAFGTVLGPHLSFAAGAAATAYAKKIGKIDSGTALGQGLASLGEPKVLAVGGLFGIIGNYIGVTFFEKKGAKAVRPLMITVLVIFFIRILTEIL
jgi:uncharacterized membrane protein YfcA